MHIFSRFEWWLKTIITVDIMFLVVIGVLILVSLVETKRNTDIVVDILTRNRSTTSFGFIPINE